ncbi:AraC family transcriptional regulator [Mucilaginibacter segetis]|uniref:Helix-turn-helix domain-containing protein n=1 Tax=Mucilaginibacter segetis TaxID=2793071 RepID=A0A934PUC7_9SPHI|nr:helix-turn-helix transcriptional regulator [Mucilaginibacter segetis]MBK0379301.1 helix-turn-helix domain-containing protein [Mucilaginibacter segetis]
MATEFGRGIAIERMVIDDLKDFQGSQDAHRHDGHSFFLLEQGTVQLEIDFQSCTLTAPAVIYIHPDQVHFTLNSEALIVNSLVMTDEFVRPEYLNSLGELVPAPPIALRPGQLLLILEMFALTIKLQTTGRAFIDSCNAIAAWVMDQYAGTTEPHSRFEVINRSFRKLLEQHYRTDKRPAAYAEKLHLSVPYLNECVKNVTGYPVSHHIRQRVILEAKRLLYHTPLSVKEISALLGYDDYPYFSRLFTKMTGQSALAFRNRD